MSRGPVQVVPIVIVPSQSQRRRMRNRLLRPIKATLAINSNYTLFYFIFGVIYRTVLLIATVSKVVVTVYICLNRKNQQVPTGASCFPQTALSPPFVVFIFRKFHLLLIFFDVNQLTLIFLKSFSFVSPTTWLIYESFCLPLQW